MQPMLAYFLKMFICSAILLGYYWMALRNERFHQWNRFYLMLAMLLSIVVPFFHLPIMAKEEPTTVITMVSALPWNQSAQVQPVVQFNWKDAVLLVGIAVSVTMLFHLLLSVFRIYRLYKRHDHSSFHEVSVVITEEQTAPFSFFKWLFWRSDIDPDSENGQRMLQHELTHISEKHSTDKLFTELVLVLFWMNPFFWIMRKELFAIHEFLADKKAIASNDGAAFAAMILQAAHPGQTPALSNPFFSSQLKRRLVMITTSYAPKYSYLRRVSGLLTMIITVFVLILTIEKVSAQKTPTPPPVPKVEALPDSIIAMQVSGDNGQCMVTYKMKDGRALKMKMDDAEKRGYPLPPPPPPAPKAEVSAVPKVAPVAPVAAVSPAPAVAPTPSVSPVPSASPAPKAPPAIPAPPSPPTPPTKEFITKVDREWEAAAGVTTQVNSTNILNAIQSENPPLIIYADLEISTEQMQHIEPSKIASIDVIKGENAVKVYGDKAKNGAIRITPKVAVTTNVRTTADEKVAITVVDKPVTAQPMYYINGKLSSELEVKKLEPIQIEKINVLKGNSAIDKYGKDAVNGVIEIITKKVDAPAVVTFNKQL